VIQSVYNGIEIEMQMYQQARRIGIVIDADRELAREYALHDARVAIDQSAVS
jgi:hypothetical protein